MSDAMASSARHRRSGLSVAEGDTTRSRRLMDVGLALPQFDFSLPGERPLRWQTVIRWAERAEAIGFGSVWLADHLFWDVAKYGGPEETFDVYDPLAGMAAIARMTAQVRLGIL